MGDPRIRAGVVAVLMLTISALVAYVGSWRRPPAGGLSPDQFVADQAELIPVASEARMSRLLHALLRDTDVELVAVSIPSLRDVEIGTFADEIFERWQIGSRTKGNRGLLLVVAAEEQRVRLAVSYALEGVFPDAFVAYVEQAQMVPYFRDKLIGEGIEATVEMIARQAFEQILGTADDSGPEEAAPTAGFRGGGAGAEMTVPLRDATGSPRPATDPASREEFGAQPTPAEAWARFLEANRRRIKDPELGLYDEAARAVLRRRPQTDAGQDHIATLYGGKPYVLREQGDRAAIVFLDDPNRQLAPWFFHRTAEGWQLDGGMYPGVIAYNHLNQWRFTRLDHPYAFAFSDFVFDRNGFATRKSGP